MAQSKIMVNNQTSQYELLNIFFCFIYLILAFFREILEMSLPIDHPVANIILFKADTC